ncbi:hypothetical protein Glove_481g97 [Diversispora epigaea]|uniref:Integrator complex subunit 10 n=1 Tax=Diversispora epigaea TaxID=1348612 RepID=A0A397GLY8_9GLOM|nr:hypothetical protein Glove_481g97 [Diversispora epigaea]
MNNVNETEHDLEWYVSVINQLLNSSGEVLEGEPSGDARLQYAIRRYHEARSLFPDSYDLKFIGHKIAIKEGDMTQAEQYFDELRRQFPDHEPLKEYLVEITNSVRHQTTDDNFMGFLEVGPKSTFINSTTKNCAFFLRLPARTQREILVHSAVRHEMSNKLVDACRLYVLLLKAYPDTATYFGVHAAQLAIECETQNQPLSEYNSYRKLFVEDILSVILRKKIIVHKESLPSDLKVYNKQDYLSIPVSTPTNYPQNVDVVYSELKLWLERAQGFYIASKDWRKLFEISLTVMDSTGYLVFPSSPRISLESFFEDPLQLYVKLFNLLNQKPVTFLTQETTQHSFCISIGIACFVHCCHEFYKLVSGSKSMPSEGKRNCLIPVWIEKVNTETAPPPPTSSSIKTPTITTPIIGSTSNAHHLSHDDIDPRVNKKRRLSFILTEDSSDSDKPVDNAEVNRGKNVMNVRNLLINDRVVEWQDSFNLTIKIVCNATVYLERALGCWDDLKLMFRRGGNEPQHLDKDLNKEVNRQLKAWNLPLDVSNAVMLTRADCELTKGNISMAFTFYREIISRISGAWNEYRTKSQKDHLKSLNDDILDQAFMDESSIKELPLLLAFRVLYSISVLYRAIGWWAQAKVELCMILATIPFTPVNNYHFEKDDLYISNTKRCINFDEKYKHQRFKLMEVTQEGLVVRVIKELMACFENELDNVENPEDPLMDETICNIIILSQIGWPYWRDRVLSQVIFPKIKSRGGLKYPNLLKFMYNVEILREILELHRTSPDLKFSLCPVSENNPTPASTTLSIKVLENRIENPIEIHINEIMVKFFRERSKDETSSNTNLFNDAKISKTTSKSWKMDVSAINNKDNTESFSSQVRINNNNKANILYNCENMDEKEGL